MRNRQDRYVCIDCNFLNVSFYSSGGEYVFFVQFFLCYVLLFGSILIYIDTEHKILHKNKKYV